MDIKSYRKVQKIQSRKTPGSGNPFDFMSLAELGKKDIKFFKNFGNKQKERFFSEIGMLLTAGVDLQAILKLSVEGTNTQNQLRPIYEKILEGITRGSSLGAAMESTGQFSNFDCFSVIIGENTGELAQVFTKLSAYYNKRIIQRRRINSSLSYPIIVLVTTIGAIYFMLKFVVPMFSETLVRFGGELPPLTKFIITLSKNISSYFLVTTVLLAGIFFLYRKNKHKESVQMRISAFLLKIPYVGKVIYKTHLVQFTQSMDLLLNSRVNIVDSIQLTQKIITFYPLKKALHGIQIDLLKGTHFYKSMESQHFFDPSMITLVRIGEEINQLDRIFSQMTKQFEDELTYQSNVLISIFEPVMILVLAVLVATILIAMYLPMFKIGTVIH